jgi:hypothetical protein
MTKTKFSALAVQQSTRVRIRNYKYRFINCVVNKLLLKIFLILRQYSSRAPLRLILGPEGIAR